MDRDEEHAAYYDAEGRVAGGAHHTPRHLYVCTTPGFADRTAMRNTRAANDLAVYGNTDELHAARLFRIQLTTEGITLPLDAAPMIIAVLLEMLAAADDDDPRDHRLRCSRCRQRGHNARTCPGLPDPASNLQPPAHHNEEPGP